MRKLTMTCVLGLMAVVSVQLRAQSADRVTLVKAARMGGLGARVVNDVATDRKVEERLQL
jgi:hypothetical protein